MWCGGNGRMEVRERDAWADVFWAKFRTTQVDESQSENQSSWILSGELGVVEELVSMLFPEFDMHCHVRGARKGCYSCKISTKIQTLISI